MKFSKPLPHCSGGYISLTTGWMIAAAFEVWFVELKKCVELEKLSQPAPLLLDGHSSHETLPTLELTKKNNIMCLPPHMTHLLQTNGRLLLQIAENRLGSGMPVLCT